MWISVQLSSYLPLLYAGGMGSHGVKSKVMFYLAIYLVVISIVQFFHKKTRIISDNRCDIFSTVIILLVFFADRIIPMKGVSA